ncbi:hypothetical protein C8J55DRAFT_165291 [Lentinula edodes]|uniref:Uncharacterized protein n=1 Tax=Lentinula lateritia TaxID=40482 RepID=A0A9W9B0D0_9AGAR|nr:hypothetical protein C8J55DRAFT_165291 [Lentinula edodes]
MDPVQNQVHEDGQQWHDASNSAPPPDIPKVHSAPPSESAQTVISGAFFAGAHRFSINGGSFNHSNGDINQDIVNDHSNRSNFGNRYGDNRSNSNNRTNNYNAGYNDNRIHGSSHWTQATARTQYRLVLVEEVDLLSLQTFNRVNAASLLSLGRHTLGKTLYIDPLVHLRTVHLHTLMHG